MKGFLLTIFTILGFNSFGQYSTDVCNEYGVVGCSSTGTGGWFVNSTFHHNGGVYTTPGNSMPIWVAPIYGDQGTVDTTFNTNFSFEKVSGPGTLTGTLNKGGVIGAAYFDDWVFSEPGNYKVKFVLTGSKLDTIDILVASEVDLCELSPSKECGVDRGDSIFAFRSTIVSVDAVYPINAGLINKATGYLDSTWAGDAFITQLSGPGTMIGTKYIRGNKWVKFIDLKFDEIGIYDFELKFDDSINVVKDTLSVEVVAPSFVQSPKKDVKVFPNPSNGVFNLEFDIKPTTVKVFSVDGRMVYEKSSDLNLKSILNLTHLEAGFYLIQTNLIGRETIETIVSITK